MPSKGHPLCLLRCIKEKLSSEHRIERPSAGVRSISAPNTGDTLHFIQYAVKAFLRSFSNGKKKQSLLTFLEANSSASDLAGHRADAVDDEDDGKKPLHSDNQFIAVHQPTARVNARQSAAGALRDRSDFKNH
ncbi:hypothetical protein M514_02962 [Trichuris suis]|uniref:Uncharacterized protein n=1 Tax=Trichuris suis TaxID=68888 RepID=A0A085MG38_9BILA|nr:hypothetical protein M513_02962 [Trichuris suis]KFD69159.1 hypothetical protein M514_02962 [Trichuris suis]